MCGICGIIDFKSYLSEDTRKDSVAAMNMNLRHRGPDEDGYYHNPGISLGMNRLAIIDLHKGSQPIFNEDQSICIVFNGEVYNFKELQEDVRRKGHTLQTDSDTEVLIHMYEEYGSQMINHLKGMFAFCIYDSKKKCVFIGRDRFGEKPLYYTYQNNVFAFSSELPSLLESDFIPRILDTESLDYYLKCSLIPEPKTIYKDIFSLPAGHFIILDQYTINLQAYHQIRYKIDNHIKTDDDAVELIKPLLLNAVKRQKVSDVPLGAFLSGGMDSSTMVALLQKSSSVKIKTFNVKFEDSEYDESIIAKNVADFCGTDHYSITIPNQDFDESIFWKIIDHVGFPFRDSSAIPTYFISKAIGKEVKVAISGDGGDEIFGGYDVFGWYTKIYPWHKLPGVFIKNINSFLETISTLPLVNKSNLIRKGKRVAESLSTENSRIPLEIHSFFTDDELKRITNKVGFKFPLLTEFPDDFTHYSPLRKIMYYRMQNVLPGNMLIKVDRMSMANSLEVRSPFLDPDLYNAASTLPDSFLRRNGKGKYILRKIMENNLPQSVFDHPKKGFGIPLYKYQNKAYIELADRLLNNKNHGLYDLLNFAEVMKIKNTALSKCRSDAFHSVYKSTHRLWMLMQLFGWFDKFKIQID